MLVFKKKLARRGASAAPGGGTIFFVGREEHVYLKSAEEREEGGTPAIVGAVRTGRLQPHLMPDEQLGLQPYVREHATVCERACNRI